MKYHSLIKYALLVFTFCAGQPQKNELQNPQKSIQKFTFDEINQKISSIAKLEELKNASLGISILIDGKEKIAYNAEKSLLPASTLKVITTGVASYVLGNDYQFSTSVGYQGKVENATLEGDLVIIGSGDPSLGERNAKQILEQITSSIEANGIKMIKGNVVINPFCYETQLAGRTWVWEDLGNYFGAGASGINFMENTYVIHLQPTKLGEKPKIIKIIPDVENLTFVNELITGSPSSGDQAWIFGAPYTTQRYLRGSIPGGRDKFIIKGSVSSPPLFFGKLLLKKLESKNMISKNTKIVIDKHNSFNLITSLNSDQLIKLIKKTNYYSNNLYAEAIFKAISLEKENNGKSELSMKIVKRWFDEKQINTEGFYMEDGCGLSSFNAVTTYQIAKTLFEVCKSNPKFIETLPRLGMEGTVKYLCSNGRAKGAFRVKSGSMKRVMAYCGISQDQRVSFSVIVNNFSDKQKIRKEIEELLNMMIDL